MIQSPTWRMFRRMQDTIVAVAALVYLAAVVQAWRVLPGADILKLQRTALFPGGFLVAAFSLALFAPPVRAFITRHLWVSYRSGYGQSVISVLGGVGVLIAVAGLIFWQVHSGAHGGPYPGGAFSGYAAGIGLLCAQALLVRRIERDPTMRAHIERADRS